MKKKLSRLFRRWADRLDPITVPQLEQHIRELSPSQGTVVEVGENPQWAPDQKGNVIVVEPMLITKDRLENGKLSKVSKPY